MTVANASFQVDSRRLAAYLSAQRWFGGKGRRIVGVAVSDAIPVRWHVSRAQFIVARAKVSTELGTEFYQLFLTEGGELTDALEKPEFTRGLADAFQTGASFAGDGVRWIVQSETRTPLVVPPNAAIRVSKTEQTNSSVVLGDEAILKLFRKLESGVHPDVEVTRFLTSERRFAHVPALLGTIRFETADGIAVAGMMQELVPGARDGWSYALECASPYLRATDESAVLPFEKDAMQLGGVTRALHEALASGSAGSEFELDAADVDDVVLWTRKTREMIEESLAALDRALSEGRVPKEQRVASRVLVRRRTQFLGWLGEMTAGIAADAGGNARVHGDYHLGQVLRSAAGEFLVIDFEGEPARPLQERRARQSPLRDVAGMLRSFAYAAAAGARPPTEGHRPLASGDHAASRSGRWELAIRNAFLEGYFARNDGNAALLPRARDNSARLIALFEAEKVFYELQYELDHRPDWIWIPLQGIAQLYA